VPLYRDEAVVLRTQKLGEADRIVTLLTRRHGRVRAVAKGVRRTGSRFGARVEPFMQVDLQLHEGRELDVVTQAETIEPYGERIATDYPRYTAGTAVLETAERLTAEEREPSLRLYLLVTGALRALADGAHTPTLVLDAFILRAMAIAGYEPALDACARCDEAESSAPSIGRRAPRRSRPTRPCCCTRCSRATGPSPTRRTGARSAKGAAWWPPTCSGTSSGGCAHCGW
jgi:DNA repair protein RecO (recombination protein O)